MRVMPFLLIAALSLGACDKAGFDAVALPSVQTYSQESLDRAATELEALPEDSVIATMIADYAVLRAQLRAGQ